MKATSSLGELKKLLGGLVRLWPHFHLSRRQPLLLLAISFLAALLEGIGVSMLLPILELLRSDMPAEPMRPIRLLMEWFPGWSRGAYTALFCALILSAIVAKNLLLYYASQLAARLRSVALQNLRDTLYSRLQSCDISVYESTPSGTLANLLITEAGRAAYSLEFLTLLIQRSAILLCYLAALILLSWQLSLFTLLLGLLSTALLSSTYKRLAETGRDMAATNSAVNSHIIETIAGSRLIRATNSQQRERERNRELTGEYCQLLQNNVRTAGILAPLTEITGVFGGMLIIGTAAIVLVQPGYMKGEMLLGFAFVLLRMLPISSQVYGIFGQIMALSGGIELCRQWLQLEAYPKRAFGTEDFVDVGEGIEFRNLTYVYPNGTVALENISFRIPAGKMVAVVGSSGSGKSTLAALLLRLREPTAGQILVAGRDYWSYSPASWHRHVAIVEQEAFLFRGTLDYNVRYGCDSASPEDVAAALRKAHLTHVVEELPAGVQTVVGERGVTLSGGQRQRLSIARALVRDPKLLILDEATSALDSISEAQVQQAIDEAQEGRTVVVIAHRFSTIRNADTIVVLEKGRVVEMGAWDELENRDGAFRRLLRASQNALV